MTEKRYTWDGDILFDNVEFKEMGNCLEAGDICDRLNEQHETIQQKQHTINEMVKVIRTYDDGYIGLNKRHSEYKQKVQETLQKHYKLYTNMAVELRHDKYSNGNCHTVLEVLGEIADELGIDLQ